MDDLIFRSAAIDAMTDDNLRWNLDSVHDDDMKRAARAAQRALARLPAAQRWVPVTERLPENFEPVLCWYEYYHWSKGKILPEYGIGYVINGRWGGEVTSGKDCKVLAWMPLPGPPKEES